MEWHITAACRAQRAADRVAAVPSAAASSRLSITAVAAVLVATALTFAPSLSGGFVWDDQLLIVANEHVRDLANLPHVFGRSFWDVSMASADVPGGAYYRPLIAAAFALEFQLFGLRAGGYHAVNVALHLACTALVALWLRVRLRTEDPAAPAAVAAAALGAALFALHPSRVESVAWISGSTDLWATLFALVALGAWQRVAGPRGVALVTAATLAAALCKESVLVLPVLLAVERGRRPWGHLAAPVAAVAAVVTTRSFLLGPVFRGSSEPLLGAAARVLSSVGHLLRRRSCPRSSASTPRAPSATSPGPWPSGRWPPSAHQGSSSPPPAARRCVPGRATSASSSSPCSPRSTSRRCASSPWSRRAFSTCRSSGSRRSWLGP